MWPLLRVHMYVCVGKQAFFVEQHILAHACVHAAVANKTCPPCRQRADYTTGYEMIRVNAAMDPSLATQAAGSAIALLKDGFTATTQDSPTNKTNKPTM